MSYNINDIARIIAPHSTVVQPGYIIEHLLIDSRRLSAPTLTLFFALQTERRNGEAFIHELYQAGVRNFVVSDKYLPPYTDANFLLVKDTLQALQQLVTAHRNKFHIPVIGITGSNGKTIVKEWLYQLLHRDYSIVRSPKSFNSQIGVPMSVWQMNNNHSLAIFEAGISQPGEMELLQKIIQPTIGVLTNIGAAHDSGFINRAEKLEQKLKLFSNADVVILPARVLTPDRPLQGHHHLFTWGPQDANLITRKLSKNTQTTAIECLYGSEQFTVDIPFTDEASIENAISCICVMLVLHQSIATIQQRMPLLQPVEMRLQLKKGINNCSVINDSYSNDISSLQIALNFLQQQAGHLTKTVILSDLGETRSTDEQYEDIAYAIKQHNVHKFIGIGPRLFALQNLFTEAAGKTFFYSSVDDFRHHFLKMHFKDEVILLKGARSFRFENVQLMFEQKVHQTVLEVNLSAMVHNLKEYQRFLQPSTRLMAMVKAFSYGSGSAEVASVLQYHKVDYLAVAYTDEGVELRKAGIYMPIMVMNPEEIAFESIVEYNLEPELFSFGILDAFDQFIENQGIAGFPVHIKLDTGMHRLGFEEEQTSELILRLHNNPRLVVKSVFSHLAGSEDPQHDIFTQQQFDSFNRTCNTLQKGLQYPFLHHILNSAGIFRHANMQLDMVRLGIGLYGVDNSGQSVLNLQPVATLRSTICQLRWVKSGETVGYSRKGLLTRHSKIATIRIGYADGFSRRLGNGIGKVWIKNVLAPVIGNVCMDMIMVDVTHIDDIHEGDPVEIFGAHLPVSTVANWCNTIPYEVMTGISQRVKREYYIE